MDIKSKSIAWCFHPSEKVRMMRTRIIDPIGKRVVTTPAYDDNLNVGVVINACGGVPYVDLQLHYLKNVNKIEKILVHDNCSAETDKLQKLAKEYGADFYSPDSPMFYKKEVGSIGEQSCFYTGLQWAKRNNVDVLVKLAERLIPCYEWINDFKRLVKESDGITFSSYCEKEMLPIRTECIGMNVNAWTNEFVTSHLKFTIDNEFCVCPEYWFDSLAKQLDWQNFSKKYDSWKRSHFISQMFSGYVHWISILGKDRSSANDRVTGTLWKLYSTEQDYLDKMNEVLKNKYTLKDLTMGDTYL